MTTESTSVDARLLWILRISCGACFAGWAWQHVYWDAPLGTILWDPHVYDLLVRMGMDWDGFVGDGETEGFVRRVVVAVGWLHAACAIMALTARRKSYVQLAGLGLGAFFLLVVAYCKFIKAMREPAMLIEHGGQFLMPVLLIAAITCGVRSRRTIWIAMVAFCMTFAGHGAYAIGWAPTPGQFYGMIMLITSANAELANSILRIAGILDFLVCAAIFIPRFRQAAAAYAALWGIATALARPVAGMSTSLIWWGADQFVHEFVYRAPHFLIPLFLFACWRWPATTDEATPAVTESTSADRSTPHDSHSDSQAAGEHVAST